MSSAAADPASRRPGADSARDDLGYLFVVTYGRSGSTLLSGLLNAIPGYLIRGENSDALRHLHHFHAGLAADKADRPRSGAPTHPFFGARGFPVERSLAGIRRLALDTVLRPKPATRVSGFKEIRWYREDLDEYVAFLRAVFPGARFLVNTRDHAGVLASGWWAQGDPDHNARHLAEIEDRIVRLADDLGEAAHRVHYDTYVADPASLGAPGGLYDWLGEPYDEVAVRATLAVRHSV